MSNIYDQVLITGGGGMLASGARSKLLHVASTRSMRFDKIRTGHHRIADRSNASFDELHQRCSSTAPHTRKSTSAEQKPKLATMVNDVATVLAERVVHVLVRSSCISVPTSCSMAVRLDPTSRLIRLTHCRVYGASKLPARRWFTEHDVETGLIIRTSWLYGPGGPTSFRRCSTPPARASR